MGIRFLLGRAGTGHSEYILKAIKESLAASPKGTPIFYIVPEQMTFQQEQAMFEDGMLKGSIRAQVTSFSRLAWRVLQETGGGTRQFISSVGIQMMLRKIIEEREGGWKAFQKALEKQGFMQQLEGMITEFKRYDVTPDLLQVQIGQLEQFVHKTPGETALENKLGDLVYIYEQLMLALQGKYVDSEDQLRMLAEKAAGTEFFQDAEIYLDGFYQFTPREMAVIEAIAPKCKSITVALQVDPSVLDEEGGPSELDLFYQTKETYGALVQMAEENGYRIDQPVILEPEQGRFRDKPSFFHLEQHFDSRPSPAFHGKTPIQIAEAVHPRAEVEGAAQEILRLVREEKIRFKDIVIFIRETETYHDLIKTIFDDYDIPVFIDEKRPMLHHALIELIRSALELIEGNWRYDAVFRVLKTGFIPEGKEKYPLDLDAIDELENYVLEYGVRSKERWLGEEDWHYQRFRGFDQAAQTDSEREMQERINCYRRQVKAMLGPFDEQFRRASTVRERCEAIYLLLEHLGVPEQLEALRTYYDDSGEIEKGREQEQVWQAVIQLFDEMVEMAGDEAMPMHTFSSALEAGFETLKFAHVPPSLDQVIVATIDRSRVSGKACAFLLGVNEGVWPMKPAADGIISEEERELLAQSGIRLAETSRRRLLDDWFYIYLSFTAAHQALWISYPLSDEEGRSKMPSQLIKRVEDLFPACRGSRLLLQDPDELLDAERFISNPVKTRAALTAQLARKQRSYPVRDIWLHVLNWYIEHTPKYGTAYSILQSLHYENRPSDLTEGTVKELYPRRMKASVSRMEMYYRCSYQHFAQYGLGLQERRTYKLDAPDIGQLFHEALKTITEWVQKEGKDFAQLTREDSNQYARRAVGSLSAVLQHQILHSSKRYQYIQKKLEEVIARAAFILSEQARQSSFSPVALEVGFGENEDLPPLVMNLPNGFELVLRGRIDRVDKHLENGELYLRIIDYKSSRKDLNLIEVYYGLALQMLAYLDVVLTHSEKWLGTKASPAGVLYFHVHNPLIDQKGRISEEKIDEEIFKKYKMQGLVLADESVARNMDTSLETGHSQVVPVALSKKGTFYSSSKVAAKETFSQLQDHIHKLMQQAGLDITSGGVHLNPYEYQERNACTFCPFRSVCQFDSGLAENQFRKLQDMKDEQVLKKLLEKE